MREKYLSIELATPNKKVSIGQANSCSAPGALGKFQVLPNHAPMVSELGIGEVKIELPAKTHYYSVRKLRKQQRTLMSPGRKKRK